MDAEQTRPLYAFFVVSLVAGLLIGQGLRGESLLDVFTGGPAAQVQTVASSPTLTAADPAPAAAAPQQVEQVVTPAVPRSTATAVRRPAPAAAAAQARTPAPAASRQVVTGSHTQGQSASTQKKPRTQKSDTSRGRVSTSTRVGRVTVDTDTAARPTSRGKGHRAR